jgi:ABC-2 type transport system ATP-binding protein
VLASSTPDALWRAPSLRVLRPAAVVCRDVSYRRLLRKCSLEVPVGMRLMLVGEPDAGASALVRVLAGLSRPRSGTVRIAGMDTPSAAGWGRRVAHLGPRPGLPVWMTPREALALSAELQGLPPAELARRSERVLAWARLPATLLDRPMRREGPPLLERTALAAALLGDPEVLLMDEPLRSIDPDERTQLLRLPGRRRTVVIASRHPASDAAVVGHVALVRGGRIALLARIEDLGATGLPVSVRGIADLAARRPRPPDAASARR